MRSGRNHRCGRLNRIEIPPHEDRHYPEGKINTAVLSIGANLGDRLQTLRSAVRSISTLPGVWLAGVSSVYETPPWGPVEQPNFLNAVVLVNVRESLDPIDFLHSLQRIESEHGRTREVHWGPRTLDIDIIVLNGVISSGPELVLPHPHASERGFVLVPWSELVPEAEIPGVGTVRSLLDSLDTTIVMKMPGLSLT